MRRILLKIGMWFFGLLWAFITAITYDAAMNEHPVVYRLPVPEWLVWWMYIFTTVGGMCVVFAWLYWEEKQ